MTRNAHAPATSHESQTYVAGYPDPIETWHDNEDLWMPWKAYLPAHGNFEGWSALEAAGKAANAARQEAAEASEDHAYDQAA